VDVPWCVGRDFNVVRCPRERMGAEFITPAMRGFPDFIFEHGLMDFPLEGGAFTWSNSLSRSWIDRFMVSLTMKEQFSMMTQRRPPHLLSDHFPILSECKVLRRGRSPFHFENTWLKADGFTDLVKNWWDSSVSWYAELCFG